MQPDFLNLSPLTSPGAQYMPQQWATTFDTIAPGFTQQFEAATGNSSEPWYQTAIRVMGGLIMTDYQRRLLNVQLERAQQGLPPLDAAQYGVGVNVGLSADTQKILIIGGLALAGLIVFMGSRR